MLSQYVSLPFLGRMFELLVIVVDDLRFGNVLLHGDIKFSKREKHTNKIIH